MEKHSVSRLSYLFAHLHLLSSYSFSSALLSSNLSLLSASSLLCFSHVHIVGSLTSKLPSNIQTLWWKLMKAKTTKKTITEAFFCVTVAKLGHPGKHDSYMQADSPPHSSNYAEASMLRAGKLAT